MGFTYEGTLYKYGFGYVWEANTVGDINRFVDVFKQRLKDCCLQAWHSDIICESPKSIHYSKFKEILEIEIYLSIDLPFTLESFGEFSMFRTFVNDRKREASEY